jgi:Lsr2
MTDSARKFEERPVRFAIDGVERVVDLNRFDAARFEAAVAPFIAAARRVDETPAPLSRTRTQTNSTPSAFER